MGKQQFVARSCALRGNALLDALRPAFHGTQSVGTSKVETIICSYVEGEHHG